jgi:hypothetical protein
MNPLFFLCLTAQRISWCGMSIDRACILGRPISAGDPLHGRDLNVGCLRGLQLASAIARGFSNVFALDLNPTQLAQIRVTKSVANMRLYLAPLANVRRIETRNCVPCLA